MADNSNNKPRGKCPMCQEPIAVEFRPFCSNRCANLDLGKWLSGKYAIAGSQDSDEDGGLTDGGLSDGGLSDGGLSDGDLLNSGNIYEIDGEDPTRH